MPPSYSTQPASRFIVGALGKFARGHPAILFADAFQDGEFLRGEEGFVGIGIRSEEKAFVVEGTVGDEPGFIEGVDTDPPVRDGTLHNAGVTLVHLVHEKGPVCGREPFFQEFIHKRGIF